MTGDGLTPGYLRLAERIILLAIRDAKDNNGHAADARAFLTSRRARGLCEALDVDPAVLDAFLAGLPVPTERYQLTLDAVRC